MKYDNYNNYNHHKDYYNKLIHEYNNEDWMETKKLSAEEAELRRLIRQYERSWYQQEARSRNKPKPSQALEITEKSLGHTRAAVKIPDGMVLLPLPKQDQQLSGAVDPTWFRQLTNRVRRFDHAEGPLIAGSVTIGGGLGILANALFFHQSGTAEILDGIYMGALFGFIGYTPFVAVRHRLLKRQRFAKHYSRQLLVEWIERRYGIKVSADQFLDAEKQINNPADGNGFPVMFTGENGKQYELHTRMRALHVQEAAVPVESKPTAGEQTPAIEPSPAPTMTELATLLGGEPRLLFGQLQALLAQVENQDLGLERRHIINRVAQDTQELLLLNQRAVVIQPVTPEQATDMAAILTTLIAEVQEVLAAEVQDIGDEIASQLVYVRSRRIISASAALILKSPAQLSLPTATTPQQEEPQRMITSSMTKQDSAVVDSTVLAQEN